MGFTYITRKKTNILKKTTNVNKGFGAYFRISSPTQDQKHFKDSNCFHIFDSILFLLKLKRMSTLTHCQRIKKRCGRSPYQ